MTVAEFVDPQPIECQALECKDERQGVDKPCSHRSQEVASRRLPQDDTDSMIKSEVGDKTTPIAACAR